MTRPVQFRPSRGRLHAGQRGIALLEALIASVILAIGLLGTIGLQARSYAALSDAAMRTEAAVAADKLLGIMNTDLPNLGQYAVAAGARPNDFIEQWHSDTTRLIPGATISVGVVAANAGAPAVVNIAISWRRKADTPVNTHRITSYFAGST